MKESAENYLEAILILSQGENMVRSIDVANALGYARASVSIAMNKLRHEGHIETDSHGFISLTESGRKIAELVYEKHTLISGWLISLGVDKQTAISDACRMEHVISEQSFLAIKNYITNN